MFSDHRVYPIPEMVDEAPDHEGRIDSQAFPTKMLTSPSATKRWGRERRSCLPKPPSRWTSLRGDPLCRSQAFVLFFSLQLSFFPAVFALLPINVPQPSEEVKTSGRWLVVNLKGNGRQAPKDPSILVKYSWEKERFKSCIFKQFWTFTFST